MTRGPALAPRSCVESLLVLELGTTTTAMARDAVIVGCGRRLGGNGQGNGQIESSRAAPIAPGTRVV